MPEMVTHAVLQQNTIAQIAISNVFRISNIFFLLKKEMRSKIYAKY